MSLRRQLAMGVSTLLLLIFVLLAAFDARQSRNYLNEQLTRTAQDAATSLALSMQASWQAEPDVAILRSLAGALFDRGLYTALRLQGTDGTLLLSRVNNEVIPSVPSWFQTLYRLQPQAASAELTDGWRTLARLDLAPHPGLAYANLWSRFQYVMVALVLGGALSALLVYALIGRLLDPLNRIRQQTESWAAGSFRALPDCDIEEIQPLVNSLNGTNLALADLLTGLQRDLDSSRRENDYDPVTGLLNREAYCRALTAAMEDQEGLRGAVLMIRIHGMAELNLDYGRKEADKILHHIASQFSEMTPQASAIGRLNGSDWSLLVMGLDQADARQQCTRLAGLESLDEVAQLTWQVVATPIAGGMALSDVFGRLDRGLLENPADPWIDETQAMPGGRASWTRHVMQMFAPERLSFNAMPVVDRSSGKAYDLLMASLPDDDGQIIGAPSFIPLLHQLGRLSELDQAAVNAAIDRASEAPQGVTLSVDALAHPERLADYIEQIGQQRDRIHLEISQADMCACADQWNRLEALLGQYPNWVLKHAGLQEGTVDLVRRFNPCAVKLANGLLQGAMDQGDPRGVVRTTSHLLRSLRCKVWAEGISDQAMWDWVLAQGLDGGQGHYPSQL